MSLLFRKRIKIAPGIHINISKSGLSLNLGVPGLNTTIGKTKKTTIGLPGTGLYFQTTNSGLSSLKLSKQPLLDHFHEQPDNIISVSPELINAGELAVVSKLYSDIIENANNLSYELSRALSEKSKLEKKLFWLKIFIVGFIPTVKNQIIESIAFYSARIAEIKEDQDLNYLNVDYKMDDKAIYAYDVLCRAFQHVTKINKIWDINRSVYNDRIKSRSAATSELKRVETKADFGEIPLLKTSQKAMKFVNTNGPDIYIYPSFVIFREDSKFTAVDFNQIQVEYLESRFIEEDELPDDAKTFGATWKKVNKDGTPDRRFSDNYQIPIVKYGKLIFKIDGTVHEEFMLSNYEIGRIFYNVLHEYQKGIKRVSHSS